METFIRSKQDFFMSPNINLKLLLTFFLGKNHLSDFIL
jgi:hypothetical protein